MSIATADMKHGLKVTANGKPAVWEVLDRAPRPGTWWLHRWEGDNWLTLECKQTELDAAQELSPVLTHTTKWTKGPFTVTSRNSADGTHRVQGHVVGVWGVHRNESKMWTLTHLPTGLSVPTNVYLGTYSPVAADMRRVAEYMAGHTFPQLDALPIGANAAECAPDDVAALRTLLAARELVSA